jgi:hypothetical protein
MWSLHLLPPAPSGGARITFFILYVDDGLILSNRNTILLGIVEFFGKEFEIRSLPADRFIGVNIEHNRTQKTIHLSQPDYIKKILARFGMTDCSTITVTADPCVKLSPSMCPRTEVWGRKNTNGQCSFFGGAWFPNAPCPDRKFCLEQGFYPSFQELLDEIKSRRL